MTRALIIPDIHNDTVRAEAIISEHSAGCDRIIFLGDYFDQFHDTATEVERVARWLVKSVRDSRRIHLLGNHDVPYLAGEMTAKTYRCPGWSAEKFEAVSPILQDLDRKKIHAAVECNGWLISHAGFHSSHLHSRTLEELLHACREAFDRALAGKFDPLFAASRARGFGTFVGGVTWLDWSREFLPVDGWHQIVGHTPARSVRAAFASETSNGTWDFIQEPVAEELSDRGRYLSMNWCLDTALTSVGIIEGSKLEIIWL